jgi:hypothetical protein
MARENPTQGNDRIQGALANLGRTISDSAVANILRKHGIEPAPERKHQATAHASLKAHWDALAASDFTTRSLDQRRAFHLLSFVLELATRGVQLAGCTGHPTEVWMIRVGRNLTDPLDGFLRHKRYLFMDRDGKQRAAFRELVEQSGPRFCSPAAPIAEFAGTSRTFHSIHKRGMF